MIAKVTQGGSGRALIRYLFGPGKANEHTDQRVITSGIVMGVDEGCPLSPLQIGDLGVALDAANDIYRTDPAGGHIFHLSLSLRGDDRHLSDDQWAEIAHRAIEAIGFEGEGREPAAWVAVAHGSSAAGNQHIHIAASLVRADGRGVNLWQSKKTLSSLCGDLERSYGLVVVDGREGKGMPGLTRAELERTERTQAIEPPRIKLARLVREASVASVDEAEFVRRLKNAGILVRPRFETGGEEAVVGYSVALRTTGTDTPIFFGGGKLAKDLTLPSLRQFWESSLSDRQAAVAEWRATKPVAPGRERMLGGPEHWQAAVATAERVAENLLAIPPDDLGAWRGAAREAAGVFAACSRRFEGESPGPWAATADALARSAQSAPGDPVPPRTSGRSFSGIAAVLAQSELGNDSPIVWAMLVDQLGRTLRAIGDAHAARGELGLAKAVVAGLEAELGGLHVQVLDPVEAHVEREVEPEEETPRRQLYVSGPGGTDSVLDPDFDDPNMDLDDLSPHPGGIDFER